MKIRFNPLLVFIILLLLMVLWFGFSIEIGTAYNGELYFHIYLLPLSRFF